MKKPEWGRYTQRGGKVYAHVFERPTGPIVFEGLGRGRVKKARFLTDAVPNLGLSTRAVVVNRQFEETDLGDVSYVTCRALDKFTEKLPRLVKWVGGRTMLLFGGPSLREAIQSAKLKASEELLPMSDQRFLFVVNDKAPAN